MAYPIFFFLFMATQATYGSSQARVQIGAVVVAYTTATATTILNLLKEAKDQTYILTETMPGS